MKAAIVIPVYNHAASIAGVIEQVRAAIADLPEIEQLLIVNDGCTDATPDILKTIPNLTILCHPKNQGKGAALLTAFQYARQNNFTHVLTIDADGQHDPADIAHILAAARQHPDDLIIGYRDMECRKPGAAPIPPGSKKGRDISRFWLRVQTGQDIPDSQCGLRYRVAHVTVPKCRFRRFDFETEVLARLAWGGLRIRSVPVNCIYFPGETRVSHFKPILDTLRGIRVNIFLVARRLVPFPFPRLLKKTAAAASHRFGRWWKPAAWRAAIHQALQAGNSNPELASAFALGVFVGLTPFYLLQTVLAIYLAKRLHLNVLAAVIGSQISIPPLAPVWIALSYGTGNLLLRGQWININPHAFSLQMLPTYLLGSFVVALAIAAIALLLARQLLSHLRPRHGLAAPLHLPLAGTPPS